MARWKLATAHYLNSPGIDWEYKELNRRTLRQERRIFPVPLFIDPDDPACWTTRWGPSDNQEGECIVCQPGKGEPNDIVFLGDPTPDMIPVDDEAIAISVSFAKRWQANPETLMGDYSQSIIAKLQDKMSDAQANPPSTKVEGMEELISTMSAVLQQNQKLLEAATHGVRRL